MRKQLRAGGACIQVTSECQVSARTPVVLSSTPISG